MRKHGALFGSGLRLTGAVVPLVWLALSAPVAHAQAAKPDLKSLKKVITDTCVKCHNTEDWAGSLALDTMDLSHAGQDPEVWEKAITKLRGRLMPPAGKQQPSQAQVDSLVRYLESSVDSAAKTQHVGYVPVQRLNRSEFANTVKSLIGVSLDARQALPTEIEVEGFNNIASALAMSPSFLEQYISAVRKAVRLAVGEPVPKLAKVTIPAKAAPPYAYPLGTRGSAPRRGGFGGGGGAITFTHVFPADGEYRFGVMDGDNIDMGLYPRGAENPATLVILVDGVEVARKVVGGTEYLTLADRDGPAGEKAILEKFKTTAPVTAGEHEIVVTYIDRSRALSNDANGAGSPNLPGLQTGVEIEGPFAPKGLSMNDTRAKIFICQPKTQAEQRPCAEKIARNMATQAFRRDATDADVQSLMKFYDMGRSEPGGFDAGVSELVIAVLSSPDFLYRAIPASTSPNQSRLLTDLELASRLSFFMWNTGPDQELIDLATSKRLSNSATLKAQVDRMFKDPRANSLVENFALAWLNLDELDKVEPENFNAAMRGNFETEIRMFLSSVLLENRSVLDLLNADWTFLNQDLAQQYGIQGVRGATFRKVKLDNENRWGLLGKGATLLRTSYSDRTSPVLRGAWILDRLLGTPPSPPPPNVVTDLSVHEGQQVTTVRARLELHRTNEQCKGCHGLIDPPGLALENFDNQGRWRDTDAAARAPIDSSTELSSGAKLKGPIELRKHLVSHPDQLPTSLTRRLMMYALNRELDYSDMPRVREIVKESAANNYTFTSIVYGIVNSDAFRRQGSEAKEKKPAAKTVASNVTSGAAATKNP
jgi:mono/diheme cytochrome c family protein